MKSTLNTVSSVLNLKQELKLPSKKNLGQWFSKSGPKTSNINQYQLGNSLQWKLTDPTPDLLIHKWVAPNRLLQAIQGIPKSVPTLPLTDYSNNP